MQNWKDLWKNLNKYQTKENQNSLDPGDQLAKPELK